MSDNRIEKLLGLLGTIIGYPDQPIQIALPRLPAVSKKFRAGETVRHRVTGVMGTVRSTTTIGNKILVDVDWVVPASTLQSFDLEAAEE
jgi:hypothetical protein